MPSVLIPRNGRVLLDGLVLTSETMRILPKVPVPSAALRALLQLVAGTMPFDEAFYAATCPDLAEAVISGAIMDLRNHFTEYGYLEGRLGAAPEVDEAFYLASYPDVAVGIANGDHASAYDHYIRSGAAEGRFANRADKEAQETWRKLIG